MWIGSLVMSTPAKSRPTFTISRSASWMRLRGTTVMSSATVPSAKPRPSLISVCSARETDVARGQLHLVGRVLLHEALALGVVEVGALAAGALGDQQAEPGERGGVVLDHLHVHQRRADAVGHGDAVAGADQGVGGGVVDLAVAAGGEDHGLGGEELHRAVADVARDRARDPPLVVLHERRGEPLLVAVHLVVLHQLLVEHVQHRLAGDVRHVVGAGGRGAAEGARAEASPPRCGGRSRRGARGGGSPPAPRGT